MVPTDQTIDDYSIQWTRYPENDGYYASLEMFRDICGPLLSTDDIQGFVTAELGAGTGRVVNMLLDAGVGRVTAVEPSAAFAALRRNTAARADKITYVNDTADRLPDGPYDLIVSFGVLDHMPDPQPALQRAFACLKPGGLILVWVYGREGNRLYLAFVEQFRRLARYFPVSVLAAICHVLTGLLSVYSWLCRFIPLPMSRYIRAVIARYGWKYRFLTIFDQLNPSFAKYFTENEVHDLLPPAGFVNVSIYHRHGYSWTIKGQKRR
jgi:SAM-dependent methyltransferase